MNAKKCLITIVSAVLATAVTHAQQTPEDLAAEKRQLAQEKAELDAREKAQIDARKYWRKKKRPSQIPLRGLVRGEKRRLSISKP